MRLWKNCPITFLQCDRSYIININYIHYYKNNKIFLENEIQIPVSRKFKADFLAQINQQLQNKIINPKNNIL